MAAPTYKPYASLLSEIAVVKETTENTYLEPTTQFAHAGGSYGRYHQPYLALAMTGTTQAPITHVMRGIDTPGLEFAVQYGPDNCAIVNQLVTGSELAGGQWLINDYPVSHCFTVNFQRSGGGHAVNLLGSYLQSASFSVNVNSPMNAALRFMATSMVDQDTATAMPALTPTVAVGPFLLRECTFKHSASSSFIASNTIKFRGVQFSITRDLHVEHTSQGTEPTCIVPLMFSISGTISHNLSTDLWDEFKTIVARDADAGFTDHFLEFAFVRSGTTQRMTLPVKLDIPSFPFSDPGSPVGSPISFTAGCSDAASPPTDPTIHLENS